MRVSDVRKVRDVPAGDFHLPDRPVQQIVEDSLRGPTVEEAVVRVDPGTAGELVAKATDLGDHRFRLVDVERDWLVRTAASFAPHAVVELPGDVREDVVKLLSATQEAQNER